MKTTEQVDDLEAIRLQLKKPKRWNWELTTSRSSPHISLPVIQLYNAKGKLLVEAKESASEQRQSWHSTNMNNRRESSPLAKLQRCRSDILDRNRNLMALNKQESLGRKSNPVGLYGESGRPANGLRESKSAVFKFQQSNENNKDKPKEARKYKRTKSDDVYRRLLKYNDESLKRAIEDGYRKFLNPRADALNEDKAKNNPRVNTSNEEKDATKKVKHDKYLLRTCSAGTLLILEESFSDYHRSRLRKNKEDASDKASERRRPNRHASIESRTNGAEAKRKNIGRDQYDLFYSKSDVFPFERLLCGNNKDDKCGEKERKTRQKKVKRRCSDEKKPTYMEGGSDVKARVIKEHKKESTGDVDLLQLVRRLSSDHVKMGANVSRHSSKGLSGRRTQSSGSICNGKGRHGSSEPKICGSLPSYLDERDGTGCNNNHRDCEKPPLDDVERIPPLGDGAPLHWKFSDNQTTLCDQGYGSERSPEEEYPPPLPEHDNQCHHHLDLHSCYPFITPESTFSVSLAKGSRGLGLSVTGGVDSGGSWPGLIRVKRLFPHQPAAACGMLNVGDLILDVNGITLTGLTNYEALEVLRTAPNQVELKICRPPPDVLSCVSPISEVPPPPPRREPPSSLCLPSVSDDEHCHGEFEVTMRKLQGSLGFTLRKEDDSALGHYIRALVREPALTDGRIRAGDKIIAVNDVEISPMTHEEAVQFLRQSGEIVKLRLYRDLAQTPVATLSPTETTPRTSFTRKAQLRQEAVDMLNDIAVRKLIPGNHDVYRRSLSPNSSPRRLRRPPCPSDASHLTDSSSCKYQLNDEQFHEGLLKKCSLPFDENSFNSLFIEDDDCDRPSRPSSLDLYNPNQTPVATRKPKFNFSLAHNAYELNNLDAEILDAPNLTYNMGNDDVNSTEVECGDSFPQEPASMPHIPTDNPGFSYKNPAYQSAHPQCCVENGEDKHVKTADDSNMKKWKGVVFSADEERDKERRKGKDVFKDESNTEILSIELNRGWNSRLGFSLQGAAGVTYVSAVHADSVASRDGRIKPGDRLLKVNDESVENMSTNEIIDLLRIVRGPVCIVVSRTKSKEDCIKSNAVN